jgi:hypothetical protein
VAQADVSFALGVPHTPWFPARVESLRRLIGSLYLFDDPEEVGPLHVVGPNLKIEGVRIFTDRAPYDVWSGQMWRWGVETGATHFLTLQDDAMVAPNFWPALRGMVEAAPDRVIGLESVHQLSLACPGRWYTTSEGLIGVGYVVPVPMLRSFLEWRSGSLCKGGIESVTEDTLICTWALVTGHRIWHPMPTIIDHDTEIPSTYGNDGHTHRRPLVTWRDIEPGESAAWWKPAREVPHAGQFYGGSVARVARRWVKGATDADWERWKAQ